MGGCGYANPFNKGGFTFGVLDTINGTVWQSINALNNNRGQFGN
jgi:hypothetical protein